MKVFFFASLLLFCGLFTSGCVSVMQTSAMLLEDREYEILPVPEEAAEARRLDGVLYLKCPIRKYVRKHTLVRMAITPSCFGGFQYEPAGPSEDRFVWIRVVQTSSFPDDPPKFEFEPALCINFIPTAEYPENAPPTIMVIACYPGAGSKKIADTIASPIEQEVSGLENIQYFSSESNDNGSYTLTITFKSGTNDGIALVNVQNAVHRAESKLPAETAAIGIRIIKAQDELKRRLASAKPVDYSWFELFSSPLFYGVDGEPDRMHTVLPLLETRSENSISRIILAYADGFFVDFPASLFMTLTGSFWYLPLTEYAEK